MTKIKFHTNQDQLNNQIQEAIKRNSTSSDMVAVVTVAKLKSTSRKTFYGFHFEKRSSLPEVGQVQKLEDLSVRRIEYICN